ncbi:methylated-DNA--[protein]-cysteine S-methyltransferase [Microbacterium karelineae]|uniref:methylated-DNA--[protein]-cysteine S-methyltransferase n=1 Tax=Microbacterium karelineae TaxID=2654283 RepID=UPI0012EA63C4|nr:methylated-DNA--[protein]-cysteine S-methyltransferase [Microbacterium karelineae]
MTAPTVETLDTPDGPFTLIADTAGAVLASGWTDDPDRVRARIHRSAAPGDLRRDETSAGEAVRAYYAGDLGAIDGVPVRQRGTPLQEAGWAALRAIPSGAPLTYAEFARELGSPRAVRAAAAICARNAPALFVPCHRVLRSDGSLGGFAWGLGVKRALLAREGGPVDGELF